MPCALRHLVDGVVCDRVGLRGSVPMGHGGLLGAGPRGVAGWWVRDGQPAAGSMELPHDRRGGAADEGG
ncbi:hypothetical protein RB199_07950 [Streptomyces libani]